MRQLDLQRLPREPGLQRILLYGEMIRRHYGLSRFHPQNTIRSLNTRIPRLYDNYEQIRPVVSIFQQSFTLRHTPRFIEENTSCSMKSVFQNSKVSLDSFHICSICLRNTYDIESMFYLFQQNEEGDYVNIPYHYVGIDGERRPNFPVMENGKRLDGYRIV